MFESRPARSLALHHFVAELLPFGFVFAIRKLTTVVPGLERSKPLEDSWLDRLIAAHLEGRSGAGGRKHRRGWDRDGGTPARARLDEDHRREANHRGQPALVDRHRQRRCSRFRGGTGWPPP